MANDPGFVHLHVHSAYSLLEGALTIGKLAEYAKSDRQPALALTDTDNMFGALEFSEKLAATGIQPIVGCALAIDFGDDTRDPRLPGKARALPRIVLLAADMQGYRHLMELSSRAHLETPSTEKPHLKAAWLEGLANGVIALTGGWLATHSAMRPIRRLTSTVQRIIRTGRTDTRVPLAGTHDAIEELTVLFNAMLERIEALVTAMRGSLDNVSHDLRTPLTRLRGTAEMALAGEPDLDRYRDALAECVEEADRVLVMLNALMDISEAESGVMPRSSSAFCSWPKSAKLQRMTSCGSPFSPVLSPISSRP